MLAIIGMFVLINVIYRKKGARGLERSATEQKGEDCGRHRLGLFHLATDRLRLYLPGDIHSIVQLHGHRGSRQPAGEMAADEALYWEFQRGGQGAGFRAHPDEDAHRDGPASILQTISASIVGYGFSRFRFPGKR